jgi:hypothetical protein
VAGTLALRIDGDKTRAREKPQGCADSALRYRYGYRWSSENYRTTPEEGAGGGVGRLGMRPASVTKESIAHKRTSSADDCSI